MKKCFVIFSMIVAFALNVSCSGSDEGETSTPPVEEDFFYAYYASQAKYFTEWQAVKRGDVIEVSGVSVDGFSINIKLNTLGDLYSVTTNFNSETYSEPYYCSSEWLTNGSTVDTKAKIVKVYFIGQLFKDFPTSADIQANMQIHYTTETPDIAAIGTSAKFNNVLWHGTATGNKQFTNTATALEVQNENEFIIGIVHPDTNPVAGTFSFSGNDFNNGISFTKYDKNSHQFIRYNVSGTIKYTTVNSTYVEGTFTLTATHPVIGNTITITNGVFKELLN